MSRVLIDGAGYTEACDALYDGNHAIHDALDRLSGALDGSAGMAGGDQSGEQWARGYDGAARQLTEAGSQLCDAIAQAANLTNTSLANHDAADGASIYGGYPGESIAPSRDRNADHRAEGIYLTVPSAYGSPGGGEPGWWHWIASHMHGWFWPNADTATLRRVGSAWQSAGVAIQCAGAFASSAADCLSIERSPEIAVATKALGDLERHCSDIGAAFVDLGKACEDYAQMVEDKHHEIEDEIGSFAKWTAGTEVAGGVISLVTGGLAEVPTQFVEGAEVANAARRVIESLKALLEAVKGSELVAAITTRIENVTTLLARFLGAGEEVPELEEAAEEAEKLPELVMNRSQLESKFKHAADFGVLDSRGAVGFEKYGRAVDAFVHDEATIRTVGTYRGRSVILNYDTRSRLVVVQAPDGSFISGWKMTQAQLKNVINRGSLGGG